MSAAKKKDKGVKIAPLSVAVKHTYGKGKNKRIQYRVNGKFASKKDYEKAQIKADLIGQSKKAKKQLKKSIEAQKKAFSEVKPKKNKVNFNDFERFEQTQVRSQSIRNEIDRQINGKKAVFLAYKGQKLDLRNKQTRVLVEIMISELNAKFMNIFITQFQLMTSPEIFYFVNEDSKNVYIDFDDFDIPTGTGEGINLALKQFYFFRDNIFNKYFKK